mmetsp:Transcript_30952/g.70398  ORF Transcript_30952/g.70398 Transcript_30952/m.70398 type:complete len:214 (+) Transcript_30952:623-1264(+)
MPGAPSCSHIELDKRGLDLGRQNVRQAGLNATALDQPLDEGCVRDASCISLQKPLGRSGLWVGTEQGCRCTDGDGFENWAVILVGPCRPHLLQSKSVRNRREVATQQPGQGRIRGLEPKQHTRHGGLQLIQHRSAVVRMIEHRPLPTHALLVLHHLLEAMPGVGICGHATQTGIVHGERSSRPQGLRTQVCLLLDFRVCHGVRVGHCTVRGPH